MIKGTTPTHVFTLPIDTATIKTIEITYAQSGTVKLKKCTEDCTFDGNNVSCRLSQEDTLQFDGDDDAAMDYRRATNWTNFASQFRALEDYTVDGTATGELDPEKIGG